MPSRRRRFFVLTVFGAAVALAVGVWWVWPRTAITMENAARIQPGMALAEVEAILGGPARDESTGPVAAELSQPIDDADEREFQERFRVVVLTRELWGGPLDPEQSRCWVSDRLIVRVDHDRGRVTHAQAMPVYRVHERPLDRLRRWLGL
jgi:hypothetical protein